MSGKWRYLGEKDPAEVPNNWRCSFNSDSTYQSCSDPEEIPTDAPKNAWVENRFTVGSLVWAKVAGWPWWPAIVDDDPDTGTCVFHFECLYRARRVYSRNLG